MRQSTLIAALLLAMGAYATTAHAGAKADVPAADGFVDAIAAAQDSNGQTVFKQGVGVGSPASGMSLADALTLERKASLWWEYARDVASVVSGRVNSRREGGGPASCGLSSSVLSALGRRR